MHKKSTLCIFVGYPTTENGFKLFNPETRQMLRSRDVIFAENKFETNITGCGEKGCNNIQFCIYNDSEDTEFTHDDATILVHEQEAAQPQRNRRVPDRLGALTGDLWDIVENASIAAINADEPKTTHEALHASKSKQ